MREGIRRMEKLDDQERSNGIMIEMLGRGKANKEGRDRIGPEGRVDT